MPAHSSTPYAATTSTKTADKVLQTLRAHPGATTAQIADTAELGRSTAAKTLATLASQGRVTRTPGIRAGGSRAPDQWHPTPAAMEVSAEPTDPPSVDAAQPSQAPPAARKAKGKKAGGSGAAAKGGRGKAGGAKPAPKAASAAGATSRGAAAATAEGGRLKSGALRGQVEHYMAEHPDGEYTPTMLGHLLGRSSGAIANALEKLAADNYAILVKPKPKTYRSAPAE